jgi:hypothetical protein
VSDRVPIEIVVSPEPRNPSNLLAGPALLPRWPRAVSCWARFPPPLLGAARVLLAEGVQPETELEMRRAGSSTVALQSTVGVAGGLAVKEEAAPAPQSSRSGNRLIGPFGKQQNDGTVSSATPGRSSPRPAKRANEVCRSPGPPAKAPAVPARQNAPASPARVPGDMLGAGGTRLIRQGDGCGGPKCGWPSCTGWIACTR